MGRFVSRFAVVARVLVAVLLYGAAVAGDGQSAAPAGGGGGAAAGGATNQPDPGVGNYSIVERMVEWSTETRLLNPPLQLSVEPASRQDPKDVLGELELPQETSIAELGKPKYTCVPVVPKDHGCEAIDRFSLTIRGPNTLEYHVQNHGGAVGFKINVLVHDLVPASRAGPKTVWHAGDVIFVTTWRGTATVKMISTVLMGEWNHEAVVFEVGKALPANAQAALEDLGVNQDLGDRVLYSFRVKTPKKGG